MVNKKDLEFQVDNRGTLAKVQFRVLMLETSQSLGRELGHAMPWLHWDRGEKEPLDPTSFER